MPTIEEIKDSRTKKSFKKRDYRPWDLSGNKNPNSQNSIEDPALHQDKNSENNENIIEIHPREIKNWEFHDRPETELGDIQALANEFIEVGQQQPCIVRNITPILSSSQKYELIVGERRWRAAELAEVKLKVIIKNLNDGEAALAQASENSNRKDLSDYARGMSYSRLIEQEIITYKELTDKLGISKQQVSRLLSFAKIPLIIKDAIKDFSKISARTAEQIKQLSDKGNEYIEAILSLVDKLREGKIGQEKLKKLVEKQIYQGLTKPSDSFKVYSSDGKHLFTWRQDNNSLPSIHFPRDVSYMLKAQKFNNNEINTTLKEVLEKMIK